MVAYSFQKRFEVPIRANTKLHTIRAERTGRARHARPGERVQLYFGMRTAYCRLIAAPICASVRPVRIDLDRGSIDDGGRWLDDSPHGLDAFARGDGFTDWADLVAFWHHNHPGVLVFSGVMIAWAPIEAEDFRPMASRGGGGQLDMFPAESVGPSP